MSSEALRTLKQRIKSNLGKKAGGAVKWCQEKRRQASRLRSAWFSGNLGLQ
jgi:hypothetical protein